MLLFYKMRNMVSEKSPFSTLHMGETNFSSDRKSGTTVKNNEANSSTFWMRSVLQCGEGSIWKSDLIISFGGIIDPVFSKLRTPIAPCLCLQVPASHQQQSSPSLSNGIPPLHANSGRGKCTTAPMLLDLIKEVENAVSHRKGRTGTAAGDVAFPKGKENLASVLKRYKRRLFNKPVGAHEGTCSRKIPTSAPHIS